MKLILTEEEKRIKRELGRVRGFPRWRFLNGHFLYCLYGYHWYDEVAHRGNTLWSAGEKKDGTYREFDNLLAALLYTEQLAAPRVHAYHLQQTQIAGAAAGVEVSLPFQVSWKEIPYKCECGYRDAATEEKLRRENVTLES